MAYENYANPSPPTSLIQTTLNGSIVASTTTITVVSTSGFPSTGSFHVIIDSEIILCSVASGTTLSVTGGTAGRGREGTAAASHASGAYVILSLTAESLRFLVGGVRTVSGTSDAIAATDARSLVVYTSGSSVAVTLPQGGTAGFDNHFVFAVEASGSGTVTITPTTSTIDGAASLALTTNQGCWIFSDGTNYFTMRGVGGGSISDGDKGDITVTSSGATWTIDATAVTYAKFQDVAGLSVVGRSANTSGVAAAITAVTDGHVLRLAGSTLGFGLVVTAGITDANVTYAKIQNIAGLSVAGRSANTSGVGADITAANDAEVLRRSGSTLGFGTVATAGIADDAVTYAKIQNVTDVRLLGRSAGTAGDCQEITVGAGLSLSAGSLTSTLVGLTDGDKGDITVSSSGTVWTIDANVVSNAKFRQSAGLSVVGRSANTTGDVADITAVTDSHVLRLSGSTLGFGLVVAAGITDANVTYAKIQNIAGLSVLGRSVNTSGVGADITAANDAEVLRRSGSTLGFGTVATAGIANDAVTYAKIQNVSAASKLLGRGSAGGTGDVEEITLDSSLTMSGTTLSVTSGSGITGSGTTGTIPIWASSTSLTDSLLSQSGTTVRHAGQIIEFSADIFAGAIQHAARTGVGATGRTVNYLAGAGGVADASTPGGIGGTAIFQGSAGGDGSAAQAAGTGGTASLSGGPAGANGGGGGNNGGAGALRGGVATGAGTNGKVLIGDLTTSAVEIGATGITSTVFGPLVASETVTIGGGATATEVRWLEPSGSGTNYVGFKSPALAGNTVYDWPNAFPAVTGYVLSCTTAGVMSWVIALSDGDKGDITVSASGATWTIDSGVVTLAKMANIATDSILGRATASPGVPEVLTALPFAYTGDVTRPADSNVTTIANDAVTNAKMANMVTATVKGRVTGSTGDPEDMTPAEARSVISCRELFTAVRTYYVRTDGSDSNTGLVDSAGGAFLTGQKALDVAKAIDFGGYAVTINFGAGTFSGALTIPTMVGQSSTASLIINGAGSTTIITSSNAFLGTIRASSGSVSVTLQNVQITNSNGSGIGIRADYGAVIALGSGVTFGACGYAVVAATYAGIVSSTGFTLTSNATYIFWSFGGIIILDAGGTFALGTRTVTTTAFAEQRGYISSNGCTYTGTVTGTRYNSITNSSINVFGGGGSIFPGSVAGTTATGGIYG